jgi:hypothetical protein
MEKRVSGVEVAILAILFIGAMLFFAPSNQKKTVSGNNTQDLKYSSHFVADITYPDGTEVAAGQYIKKTWRIQNTGSADWKNLFLCKSVPPAIIQEQAIPDTKSGDIIEVSSYVLVPIEAKKGEMIRQEYIIAGGNGIHFIRLKEQLHIEVVIK